MSLYLLYLFIPSLIAVPMHIYGTVTDIRKDGATISDLLLMFVFLLIALCPVLNLIVAFFGIRYYFGDAIGRAMNKRVFKPAEKV